MRPRPVGLALQGGGSHGAYAWGILDGFLEDGRLEFEGICGTSAGSVNAVLCAYGLLVGGREGARRKLDDFWRGVAGMGALFNPAAHLPVEGLVPGWPRESPMALEGFKAVTRLLPPYQWNPLDWNPLRARIKEHGMRNSNCVAIAPTATISNIIGVAASIEPEYQNIYVKSNLSGEFTVVNEQLVKDLKALDLWDDVMVADLKYFDGSLAKIDRVPAELRELYATAFEVEPKWIVEAGARRQKWIDQAQSLNIYMAGASGKKLDETYKLAWVRGLKTTYYLRSLGATHAEKSTVKAGQLNAVPSDGAAEATEPKFCAIDAPDCEACQ